MAVSSHGRPGQLWHLWQKTASAHPRACLLRDAATSRSYTAAYFTAAVEKILCRHPLSAATAMAWKLPNGPDWLTLFLATQFAGIAALPLDPDLSLEQGRIQAQRLGASHWWDGDAVHLLRPAPRPWPGVAVIKATSGFTGAAVALPWQASHLLADYRQIRAGMGLRPSDINLGLIPFGHSYGLGNLVLPLLCDGIPIVTAAAYTITQVREWIKTHRPTVFPAVPVLFRLLHQSLGSNRLGRLRLLISAGAPLPADVAQSFYARFGLRLHNFYGSSETGGICYDRSGQASLTGRAIGQPLPGVNVRLVRQRIVVTGKAVAAPKGRQVLPDRGSWNGHGELILTGRIGRLANIAGRKVTLAEIESVLRSLPGVTDAWCSVGHRPGGDFLAAAVESPLAKAAIAALLAERLPAWKRPRVLLTLATFPRTARGKADPRALRRLLQLA
jgi:acyl-CoA synthetase (AMP-forming)/AMP-acid ligase II